MKSLSLETPLHGPVEANSMWIRPFFCVRPSFFFLHRTFFFDLPVNCQTLPELLITVTDISVTLMSRLRMPTRTYSIWKFYNMQ